MYRAATIDWYSRYVLAWRLSNTLDGEFCLDMLEEALSRGQPEVCNTDQGVPFTAAAWTSRLERAGVAVSMAGKGRCLDNVFVERLWRSVKYEEVYLQDYEGMADAQRAAVCLRLSGEPAGAECHLQAQVGSPSLAEDRSQLQDLPPPVGGL